MSGAAVLQENLDAVAVMRDEGPHTVLCVRATVRCAGREKTDGEETTYLCEKKPEESRRGTSRRSGEVGFGYVTP